MATVFSTFDSSTNKDLFKVGLHKLFDSTQRKAQTFWRNVYNDLKSKDEYERDQEIAGLETASMIGEGQNIPIHSPVFGNAVTYTQEQQAAGFRITFRMDFFNKYNLARRWAKDLGKIMAESKDVEVARLFNAPTATTWTGFDGLALAHDTHTGLLSGSTSDNYDNYLAAGLSYSSLESVRYYFATLKDSLGMHVGASADTLVIESTQWPTARELMGSNLKPWESSNTKSIIPEIGLKLFEYPRLTSTTAWFVIAKKSSDYDLNVITSLEPIFVEKDAPDNTLDKVYLSYQQFDYGFGDPRLYYNGNV